MSNTNEGGENSQRFHPFYHCFFEKRGTKRRQSDEKVREMVPRHSPGYGVYRTKVTSGF